MSIRKLTGTWFCGNEASDYAKEKGYLDYATLAKAFDAVLNNNIMQLTSEIGYWDQTNGMIDNEEDDSEIFQYYIISDSGAQILKDWTNEIVFYNEELDMYVWGVTHYGTAWSYLLTDIKLNCSDEAFN